MKGCLKWQHSPSPSPGIECGHSRKCVAFGAEICEEVYTADEWDRTPTEPAGKLSYQDLLELKEIQRSLPRANQPPDLITGKPSSHFLSAVPIGLLPLLAESDSSQNSSSTSSPVTSPPPSSPTTPNWSSFSPSSRQLPAVVAWRPPHLAHLLPAKPTPQRQKPRFAFLPLLDTPPSSPYPSNPPSRSPSPDLHSDTDQSLDPPTPSLTNASLDSSPVSRASSCSPEPPSLRLPPPRSQPPIPNDCRHSKFSSLSPHHTNTHPHDSYFPAFSDEQVPEVHPAIHPAVAATMRLHAIPSPSLVPPSPLYLGPASTSSQGSSQRQEVPIVAPKPQRRRNFIVVNDIEIDLDDDDEDEAPQAAPTPRPSSVATIREPETILPTSLSNKNSQTTHHPPEPSAPAPQEIRKPPTLVLGSKHDLDIKPAPSASPPSIKIKPASAPASPIGAGALHAPICFKRVVPTSRDRAASPSSCKSGSTFSPTSSPLLVPSA